MDIKVSVNQKSSRRRVITKILANQLFESFLSNWNNFNLSTSYIYTFVTISSCFWEIYRV